MQEINYFTSFQGLWGRGTQSFGAIAASNTSRMHSLVHLDATGGVFSIQTALGCKRIFVFSD